MAMNTAALRFPKPTPPVLLKRQAQRDQARQLREARAFVRQRDGGRCRCCAKAGAQVHHLVYRSQRGEHDPSNLALLCQKCHQDIHAHLITVRFGGKNKAQTVRFTRERTT
jgi:5-methylcytosine-specific restriction endonuclease McrA